MINQLRNFFANRPSLSKRGVAGEAGLSKDRIARALKEPEQDWPLAQKYRHDSECNYLNQNIEPLIEVLKKYGWQ